MERHSAEASSAMSLRHVLYRTGLRAFRALSPTLMRGESKLARGLRGRRDAHERLVAWGGHGRTEGPIAWVHAASVGEALQARAVIEALRPRIPALQVVFTFFSPSAEASCEGFPADVCTCLPWDLPEVIGPVLDAVRPSLIVFTQREVWPTLAAEAAARDVPTVLVAGTLPKDAGRLSRAGRALLGEAFRNLRAVAAVSEEDANRFGLLGVDGDRVTVTGDPGIDEAWDRAAAVDDESSHMRTVLGVFARIRGEPSPHEREPFDDAEGPSQRKRDPVLVAGSTWPSDDAVLLPALARVREAVPGLRIVLVPHEPSGYDFAGLERRLVADGWTPARLGEIESVSCPVERQAEAQGGDSPESRGTLEAGAARVPDAILVDRVGVLADLYGLATVAYVGGGFHDAGLHSVLEPAAFGVPMLVGPKGRDSIHIARLLVGGAARVVTDVEVLARVVVEWLDAPEKKEAHGRCAMDYIENHRGSAERTANLITRIVLQETTRGTLSERET